jgi:uncharacterized protein DUF4157
MKFDARSTSRRSFLQAACCCGGSVAMSAIGSTKAFACGGIFDVACNLSHGGMSPQNLQRQGQIILNQAGNALNEAQVAAAGAGLEQFIIQSHNTAINGAMPIPPEIRQQLTGYASEDSMNRVTYKVGDNGVVNLAHLLEQGGLADAVTLIDVVVFRGPSEANDLSIWAHELMHVDQYRDWGVHSFAVQYVRNWHGVEDPAYAKGNGYAAWAQQWAQQQPQQQQGVGAFCYTPVGRFGPGPIQPFGAPCSITGPGGPIFGQIGP